MPNDYRRDRILLLLAGLFVLGAGLGMRDPWPADEPRFALVAKQMVESGEWLFPHRAGEIYADKPPLFFWMIAAAFKITGNLRVSFLLPSLFAALGVLLLVHDLALRLWNRRIAAAAAVSLLVTLQFVDQARSAQIDSLVVFWTTLGVYGFIRHLLLGPSWGWWYVAFAAMGLGVITKGVGFLPVLILIPWGFARRMNWRRLPRYPFPAGHAILGVVTMLGAISLWLVPMLAAVAASGDPQLVAYRDNILFRQTATRYANAWGHIQWPGYFVFQTIPWAWFPLTLTLPWVIPAWVRRFRRKDARALLLVGWVVLVVLFFSLSPGKRGVYILPALPVLVLAIAPMLPGLLRKPGVQRAAWVSLIIAPVFIMVLGVVIGVAPPRRIVEELSRVDQIAIVWPLLAIGVAGVVLAFRGRTNAALGLAVWIVTITVIAGWWVIPRLDPARSAAPFMREVLSMAGPDTEIGILDWREQFVLQADRPVMTFGYGRPDPEGEARDGARWLLASEKRRLLVPRAMIHPCFEESAMQPAGKHSRQEWLLAAGAAVGTGCR